MLVANVINRGAMEGMLQKGDIINLFEDTVTLSSAATAVTLAAADIATGILKRTGAPGGAVADTWPTAEQMIDAMSGVLNKVAGMNLAGDASFTRLAAWPHLDQQILEQNSSMRMLITNATGQTITETAAASSGVTISGTATIADGSWVEWLIKFLNTSKSQQSYGATTNLSTSITGLDTTIVKRIFPGMSVFGTGIAAATKVLSVNPDAASLVLDTAATASATVQLSFTPTVVIERLRGGTN